MKPDEQGYYFTVDLDGGDILHAAKVYNAIIHQQPVYRVRLMFSPFNGFHIEAFLYQLIVIAKLRRLYGDDGNRLVHDIIDRLDVQYHDVLWDEKQLDDYNKWPDATNHDIWFKSELITEWHK